MITIIAGDFPAFPSYKPGVTDLYYDSANKAVDSVNGWL